MVALNGTSLNGASLHDAPVNGGCVPPVILSRQGGGSRSTKNGSTDSQRADAVQQPDSADPPADGELAQLEAEVVIAKARADSAKDRLSDRDADMRAVLRVELIASREAVVQMEQQHEVTLAMVRTAAQTEVERILGEARKLAASRSRAAVQTSGPGVNDGE